MPRRNIQLAEAPFCAVLSRRSVLAGLGAVLLPAPAMATEEIRFGILNFGTALWESDVVARHRLDLENGFRLRTVSFASGEAAKVALHAGAVDIVVSDLFWAARQRAGGEDLCFLPYSRAIGALELPSGSTSRSLGDLAGRRLGVAGGPLDKSWLILRAVALRDLGKDIADLAEPIFGAPPLVMHEFDAGRLDAALIFWNFAAQLEERGAKPLLTGSQMIGRLGLPDNVPLLGYVFHEAWARGNADLLDRFARASRAAKSVLATSAEEWRLLEPLLGADQSAIRTRLRDAYREGIPGLWTAAEKEGAAQLFLVVAKLGGERLVGDARALDPALFWDGAVL